jgi:UDP-N-acetylmuramoylalanine-D-glutamate ligase
MLWQLRDAWQFDYGVLLSLAVDHLDRHGSMDDYTHAKRNIISHAIH